MNTQLFHVSKEQFIRILIGMGIAMALSGLAFITNILPDIITNPIALTIFVGLSDLLKKALTDEQGHFLGIGH